ncbi:MAG: CoA transferase [Acidobacteriota bacterium]
MFVPSATFAQTGAIAGVARDFSGGVLPGVTVEARSPALIEKLRTALTDGQGLSKIVDLRPGTYTVTFTLAGFSSFRREGIELSAALTLTVNAVMPIGAVEETITVSGASPVVDVQNVVQQRVMSRDVIDSLPTRKTPQNLAVLIPGVVVSGAATGVTGQDVCGSVGERHVYLSVHGSRGLDMPLIMDGMSYSNMNASGGSYSTSFAINAGTVQEVSVEVGSQSVESAVYGVRSNVIPRDGSNRLRGSFIANYANSQMQANNVDDALRAQGLVGLPALDKVWDLNPSLGGSVKRDRLWFYGSFRWWGNDDRPPGTFFDANPNDFVYTPDRSRASMSYVTGTHAFKVGLQMQRGGRHTTWYANNDTGLSFLNGVPARATLRTTPYEPDETLNADLGLFAQDQWRVNRMTLNLGLRFAYLYRHSNGAATQRSRTGRGSALEVSLFEAFGEWMGYAMYYSFGGTAPARTGASHATIAPYGPYRTSDGPVMFGIHNNREWGAFSRGVLGRPHLADDARFQSNKLRVDHRAAMDAEIEQVFTQCPSTEISSRCSRRGATRSGSSGMKPRSASRASAVQRRRCRPRRCPAPKLFRIVSSRRAGHRRCRTGCCSKPASALT